MRPPADDVRAHLLHRCDRHLRGLRRWEPWQRRPSANQHLHRRLAGTSRVADQGG